MKGEQKRAKRRYGEKRKKYFFGFICGLAAFLLVWLMVLSEITPKTYALEEGTLSNVDIKATMDVTDTLTTQALRTAAYNGAANVYTNNAQTCNDVKNSVTLALDSIVGLVKLGGQTTTIPMTATLQNYGETYLYFLSKEERENTENTQLLMTVDPVIASNIETYIISQLSDMLEVGVTAPDTSNTSLAEKLKNYFATEYGTKNGKLFIDNCISALKMYVKQTSFVDNAATELARKAAAAAVNPVIYKKGDVIVHSNDIVNDNQIQMLSDLGLLNGGNYNFKLIFGSAALILVLFVIMAIYIVVYQQDMIQNPSRILLFCILLCLGLLISILAKSANLNTMLMQVSISTMLIAILLHGRLSLVANLALSVILGMLVSSDSGLFGEDAIILSVTSIAAGTSAAYMCSRPMYRGRIFLTGIVIGITAAITSTAMGMLVSGTTVKGVMMNAAWCLAGGLLTSIICIGTLPVWESLFKVLTPTKLLEISNSNSSLQRRVAVEIPGTYHHSIVVANLAEAAAEAIDANVLLVRAGALYHDIGKLRIPECFSENQTESTKNFHSLLSPEESAKMIISHVTEGVELAKKYKLPIEVVDIIQQHHGTSRAEYFYLQAQKKDPNVNPALFTYPGPKPQTKEAAIISLADSVEASVRSLETHDSSAINAQLRKMINSRFSSGELDECNLTLREIDKITDAFTQVMAGVYHERIKYPGQGGNAVYDS